MTAALSLVENHVTPKTIEHPLTQEPVKAEVYAHIDMLVETAQLGSIVAREELVRRFTPLIRSLAYRYEKDIRDFEDACQDGYCKFLELLKDYDPKKMPPFNAHVKKMLTFFFLRRREKIWQNIDRLKTQSLEGFNTEDGEHFDVIMDEDAEFEAIYAKYWREFLLAKLPELVAELPERNRTAITLVYLKKMTHRQAGLVAGVQEITMTQRVRKGLALLREKINTLAEEKFFIF
ncbi:MAG: sigma-70 family RNA polymerase sigma factor [Eubacterium sp.]|nr:sigma-70 family RNA polymerase sigma factor [Eubacterium sp.]